MAEAEYEQIYVSRKEVSVPGVQCLRIYICKISVDVIRSIPCSIIQLTISECNLTNEAAKVISTMQQLEVLDLSNNKINDEGINFLIKLTKITQLRLQNNRLTVISAKKISTMNCLKVLNLNWNCIELEGAMCLSKLNNLNKLNLSSSTIGSIGAFCIGKNPSLRHLTLHLVHVTLYHRKVLAKRLANCSIKFRS